MSKMFTFDTVVNLRLIVMSFCSTTYFRYISVVSPVVQWLECSLFGSTPDHEVASSSGGGGGGG